MKSFIKNILFFVTVICITAVFFGCVKLIATLDGEASETEVQHLIGFVLISWAIKDIALWITEKISK